MRRRVLGVGLGVAALLAAGLLTGCQPAGGIVTGDGDIVTFLAADGQDNAVTITLDADGLTLTDTADEVNPAGSCTAIDEHSVRCPRPESGAFEVEIRLLDGNDRSTNSSVDDLLDFVEARGDDGDDVLEGGPGADFLVGGRGEDVLKGNGGTDQLHDGSPGVADADVFAGGTGFDTFSYVNETSGVRVDTDGVADDGRRREADNVGVDLEIIVGTDFADRLTGNGKPNIIIGTGGDDVLAGLGGFDRLIGGLGTDTCDVGADGGETSECEG
jgi:Ca2+-binding RTX toxin-like protein